MPCNLAVSIAKAQVPEQWMKDLLASETGQELTEVFLVAFLEEQYPALSLRKQHYRESLILKLGSFVITITKGQVQVNSRNESQAAVETMTQEVTGLLTQLADKLFQRQLKTTLQNNLGVPVEETEEMVDDAGQTVRATVFTLTL